MKELIEKIKHEFQEFHHGWCNDYENERYKKLYDMIFNKLEKEYYENLAIAELRGYGICSRDYDIDAVIKTMGLNKSEWESIKESVTDLQETDLDLIENYFRK